MLVLVAGQRASAHETCLGGGRQGGWRRGSHMHQHARIWTQHILQLEVVVVLVVMGGRG